MMEHRFDPSYLVRSGAEIGLLTAASTTGALLAMGHRLGMASLPLRSIGAVFGIEQLGGSWVLATISFLVGLGVHVALVIVGGVLFQYLRFRLNGRTLVSGVAVGVVSFALTWSTAMITGRGPGAVLPLGDRIVLAIVLAGSLVVGMRFAFPPDEASLGVTARRM